MRIKLEVQVGSDCRRLRTPDRTVFFIFPLECVHTWDMINVIPAGMINLKRARITVIKTGRM